MAAKYQTEFAVDVVEREAKAHNSAAAKRERELARERRVVEREERQQEAVRKEAEALLAADEAAKEAAQAELLALEDEAKADEAEAIEDAKSETLKIADRPGSSDEDNADEKHVGIGMVVEEAQEEAAESAPPPIRRPRGPDWESMGGPEGVIGGPFPPTINVGAALEALVSNCSTVFPIYAVWHIILPQNMGTWSCHSSAFTADVLTAWLSANVCIGIAGEVDSRTL